MLRIGLADAVAYRAEMLIWVLSTTMPLVMMPLWLAVTRQGAVAGLDHRGVVAYFLATFLVRQLTSAWVAWQINFEVRQGTLAMRLLRPVSPLLAYAVEHVAAIPVRVAIAFPVAVGLLVWFAPDPLPDDALGWALTAMALVGAWLLTFFVQVAIGALSLRLRSSLKLVDVWFAGFLVFSGYLVPLRAFPSWLQSSIDWLPFRYQLGLPVELLTSAHPPSMALTLIGRQWAWVTLVTVLAAVTWRMGLRRFAAYGG
jgi:ABC-2 type transport system permease protein